MLALVAAIGCSADDAPQAAATTDSTPAATTDSSAPEPAVAGTPAPSDGRALQPGLRFDPSKVINGQRIGELTVATGDVQRAVALPDSPYVGRVRFSGELELTGKLMAHPDADVHSVCFEPDAQSAARLPRMTTDNRRAWMCFLNDTKAHELKGALEPPFEVRVRITDYTTSYSASDAVNGAALMSLEPKNK
jgi:hypothetical protein